MDISTVVQVWERKVFSHRVGFGDDLGTEKIGG